MPNWCNNTLEISHEDPAMMARVRKAFTDGRLLDEFIPVPKSLQIVAGRCGADDNPEQIALEAAQASNLETHGYKDWYDYCVNEWGTKWDIGGDGMEPHDDGPNRTTLAFDSAWAPPCAAMDKLMDMGFSIRLYYYEPGMAFCGIYDENGDNYFDIGGMNSEQVAEELPSELDEMFCISEQIAEYEEEENQEIDLDGGLSAINEQENNNDTK